VGSGEHGQVLIFTRTTGYRHANIEKAAAALASAVGAQGFRVRTTADPASFSTEGLAAFKGVILLSTTGKPLGEQAEAPLKALEAWVRAGGALIGIHAASSTQYDPAALPYTRLVGGKFIDHPGSVRAANCHPTGKHPAVEKLPSPFPVRDEIYRFEQLNPANTIILTCDQFQGTGQMPVAWHRTEGAGRVFYSALGHSPEDFAPDAPKFRDHFLPGIFWALGR
jgi:type 1 glutamine amidotransferase